MPFTLDLQSALVVIDLQKGIVGIPSAHPMTDVIANGATLARTFRAHGRPVVLVNVTGMAPGRLAEPMRLQGLPDGWTELIPELKQAPEDHLVTKQTWGAFTGTDLEAALRSKGVTQIVLAGVATSAGVESTARFAHELGFNVLLATDAMTDRSAEAHENSVTRIFPRLGELAPTAEIVAALEKA